MSSDLAFRENLAFHANYDGFRIIDISDRRNPVEISHTRCQGNQGDIVVWGQYPRAVLELARASG